MSIKTDPIPCDVDELRTLFLFEKLDDGQLAQARQDHGLDGLVPGLSAGRDGAACAGQPGSAMSARLKPTSSPKVVSMRWRSIP